MRETSPRKIKDLSGAKRCTHLAVRRSLPTGQIGEYEIRNFHFRDCRTDPKNLKKASKDSSALLTLSHGRAQTERVRGRGRGQGRPQANFQRSINYYEHFISGNWSLMKLNLLYATGN